MTTKERILTIRLLEKMDKQPIVASCIEATQDKIEGGKNDGKK